MSSVDDRNLSRSGPVEVVSEQKPDGSFEIRVTRHDDDPEAASVAEATTTSSQAVLASETRTLTLRQRLIVGVAIVAVFGLLAAMMLRTPSTTDAPKTRSVSASPEFQGFVVESQAPVPARRVDLNFPTVGSPASANRAVAGDTDGGFGTATGGRELVAPTPMVTSQSEALRIEAEERAAALEALRVALEGVREQRDAQRAERAATAVPAEAPAVDAAEEAGDEYDDEEAYDEYEE